MFTRLATYCIPSLVAARPYEASGIIWFIGKIFLDPVAVFVVVGPEVHIVIRPLSFIVDLLSTYGSVRSVSLRLCICRARRYWYPHTWMISALFGEILICLET
jgi:hypothetical protein